VLATVAIVWLGVLRIDLRATRAFDLQPEPDATEYFAGAVSLVREHDFVIHLADRTMPPRFPPGYSVVLAGAMLAGVEPIRAPFVVNAAASILLLLLVFAAGALEGSLLAGALGMLMLGATPGFVTLARSPLSEPVSFLLLFLVHWLLFRYVKCGRLALGVTAAVLLGLVIGVRFANVFFGLAPLLAALSVVGLTPRQRLLHLVALGAGIAIGIAPLLAYDRAAFGHVLGNGYQVWAPRIGSFSGAFGFEHLLPNLRSLCADVLGLDKPFSVANLFGPGTWFGPCTAVLFLIGAVLGVREHCERWFWCSAAVHGSIMMAHWAWEARYQLAPLPFACVLVAMRLARLRWPAAAGGRALAAGAVLLVIGHVLGLPGRGEASDLVGVLRTWTLHGEPGRWVLAQTLAPRVREGDLVITEWSPPCLHALLGKPVTVSPVPERGDYSFNPAAFTWGPVQQQEQIAGTLARGGSVYALLEREDPGTLAPVPGRTWERLERIDIFSLYVLQ